ncbi:MAG TPA: translation initiation factor IF-2, partial [Pyrinomonadaceae bacterium]|nr:translation initiation factor IF-2 [Pyrinomonadaceae bacterium]
MTTSKIRIYDLAKELKLDTKRLIEEVRREGVDVSVPSNSVSKELAEKIRNKYFPKKETAVKRAIKVVKKAARPVEEVAPAEPEPAVLAEPEPLPEPVVAQPEVEPTPAKAARPVVATKLLKKLPPATRAEAPEPVESDEELPLSTEVVDEQDLAAALVAPSAAAPEPVRVPGTSHQIRVMRPTAAALNAGIRPGERAPTPIPPPVTPKERAERSGRVRERNSLTRTERQGTPGETATPQTTYIPPPDAGRRRSRRAPVRGGRKGAEGKGGRFDKGDFIPPPRTLSLEDRIAGRMDASVPGELKPARLVEGSTVKEFAEKLGIKPKDVVALLLQRGVFATINQPLNDDVAVDLGKRFGYDVAFVPFEEMVAEEEFEELIAADADDVELPRAPVVTVMGHVDHGKTSLLDGIRATDVAGGEAGGITQHIGAYSVQVPNPENKAETRRVVFLDTPGHEAFTMMRARGAKATDIVVLVVAADDGVMPQTIEAIEHSRAAKVPIIVAINKIDKPDANPDRVKQELAQQGLSPVEWGGETEMVQVSAKKRQNIDTLLETILLSSDILNLRASPTRLASGVVLEAKLDRGRGPVATVLVQQGTLRTHDPFIVGQISGKVRAMFNDRGEAITEAIPATPVEVLGLQGVPQAGESFQVVADIGKAQQISQHRQMLSRQAALLQTTKRGIEALGESEVKELLVVIKADVQGSVEVLKSTLQKLSTERVKVKVIRSGVGAITESDVLLAS